MAGCKAASPSDEHDAHRLRSAMAGARRAACAACLLGLLATGGPGWAAADTVDGGAKDTGQSDAAKDEPTLSTDLSPSPQPEQLPAAATPAPPIAPPPETSPPWQAGLQATYLWQYHPSFPAPYDGPHSLVHTSERGYTLSSTLFLGWRPWRNTELYLNPEVIQSEELSELHGLGAFSNAENQKTGSPQATLYLARVYLRQTIPLGGEWSTIGGGPNQVAGRISSRRLVLTAGRISLIDVFDPNAYAHDGRTQFMNWVFMTHAASDYAADARGYTWGLAAELYFDAWAVRVGRFAQPKQSNGLAMDFELWKHYGDNFEIEHAHAIWGRPGKLRLMTIRNYARMAAFNEAVSWAFGSATTPELAPVRRDQAKVVFGLAFEQALTADLGAFARLSWNDGRTETFAFTEIDRSATAGVVMRGRLWRRPADTCGLGLALDGISAEHRRYLAAGGLGPFIGDGELRHYAAERLLELYYSAVAAPGLWVSGGYQWIGNPAYNTDRGPVSIFSIRVHAEY